MWANFMNKMGGFINAQLNLVVRYVVRRAHKVSTSNYLSVAQFFNSFLYIKVGRYLFNNVKNNKKNLDVT